MYLFKLRKKMFDSLVNESDGFILVYDVGDVASYESIKIKHQKITTIKNNDKYITMIVGNKTDLDENRKITKKEAEECAKALGALYIEVSALEKKNVNECFFIISRAILEKMKKNSKKELRGKWCYCV